MIPHNILVVGASGFVGSHLVEYLHAHHIEPMCATRRPKGPTAFFCDFNQHTSPEWWLPRLEGIDIVINTSGVLCNSPSNKIDHVHQHGPKALLEACMHKKIARFVHVSALGVNETTTGTYGETKHIFDTHLINQAAIDWVILKPSIILGTRGSKGVAMMKRLASLPVIPLIGGGTTQFQPIHIQDLVQILYFFTTYAGEIKHCFDVVGPEVLTMKELILLFRKRKSHPYFISVSTKFLSSLALLADRLYTGSLISTAHHMLKKNNIGDPAPLITFTGIRPRSVLTSLDPPM